MTAIYLKTCMVMCVHMAISRRLLHHRPPAKIDVATLLHIAWKNGGPSTTKSIQTPIYFHHTYPRTSPQYGSIYACNLGNPKEKASKKRREAWSVRWHKSMVFHGFSLLLNKGMQFCCLSCWFDISWCEPFAGNHGVFLSSRWITVDFLFPDLQKSSLSFDFKFRASARFRKFSKNGSPSSSVSSISLEFLWNLYPLGANTPALGDCWQLSACDGGCSLLTLKKILKSEHIRYKDATNM